MIPQPKNKILGWCFAALFVLDAAINLYGAAFHEPFLSNSSKCWLMPLLAACGLFGIKDKKILTLYLFAMVFHTAGDIFLMTKIEASTAAGMAAFLGGHIFYLCIIWKMLKNIKLPPFPVFYCPLFALALILAWPIMNIGGPFRWGVAVYASMLLTLITYSIAGAVKTKNKSWYYLMAGTVLFTVSDLILGFGIFCKLRFPLHHFAVMSTYITAQMLILTGIVKLSLVDKAAD